MDILTGLNPAQAEVVQNGDGPMLVLAGAGSGRFAKVNTVNALMRRQHMEAFKKLRLALCAFSVARHAQRHSP